jgi:hypothetical protein
MMYARMKALVLCVACLIACAQPSPPAASAVPAASVPAPAAKRPVGPVKTTTLRLFDEFMHADIALVDRYRDGVTFSAVIKTVGEDERGRPVVWIDVDGTDLITLDFSDPPPTGLRAGATLTVTCRIAGASGALMMVTACTPS